MKAAGGRFACRWVAAGLLLSGLGPAAASASPVLLHLRLPAPPAAGAPLDAVVELIPQGAAAQGPAEPIPEPIRLPAKVPGTLEIQLKAGTAWRVQATMAGHWSPERIALPVEGRATELDLPLVPVGRLKARVRGPQDGKAPASLAVRLRALPGAGVGFQDATLVCPLRAGSWDCAVPAGRFDLRLKGEGLVPVYGWGVQIEPAPGPARDLGTLQLRRGSSVSGWVTTEAALPPKAGCRVELTPELSGRRAGGDRAAVMTLEARTNERGFFQFEGVAPGSYVVRLAVADYAPARRAPIVVHAGMESELLEPLVLARPVTLEVVVHPATDPYGQRWRLQLHARDAPEAPPVASVQGAADGEGRWSQGGLAPGSYQLFVLGDLDARWAWREIDVQRGQPPVEIELPLVEVEGTVRRAGEPLAATLWFGGKSGSTRIRFDADVRGVFSGVLPREGSWPVTLESERLRATLKPVEVKAAAGQRRAKLAIEVPDTRVAGEVVDEAGRTVAQAMVSVYGGETETQTDDSGDFELRGLAPGTIGIEAEKGEATSGVSEVALAEKQESPRLHLVLRKKTEVRGRVVAATGPVPGAEVVAAPSLGDVGFGSIESAVTDVDGTFHLTFPLSTKALNLMVFPPGFAMRMLPAAVDPQNPIEVVVQPDGGDLVLAVPGLAATGPQPLLAHAGSWTVLSLLIRWMQLQGAAFQPGSGTMVLPNVEPGAYTLCRVEASPQLRHGQSLPEEHCASAVLAPYSRTTLQLPGK